MSDALPRFRDALVLTGGGTGGHFFPAIALAEGARARWPERPIAFVGAQRGIEARELPASPWPHLLLDVEGFLGRSPLRVAKSAWKLWRAMSHLKALWRQERPWAVVGTGGYGAAPALLAARALGIPFFLHESNAAPGALIKHLAPAAGRVWCGMEAVRPLLPKADCRVVGTPVRDAFLRSFPPANTLTAPYRLLVLGAVVGPGPSTRRSWGWLRPCWRPSPSGRCSTRPVPPSSPAWLSGPGMPGTPWYPSSLEWTRPWRGPAWC